jgi:predicted RNA-binding Zn ribbon-like protein
LPSIDDRADSRTIESIEFISGSLALDFVNTVDVRGSDDPHERLVDPEDIVVWARLVGMLDEAGSTTLLGWCQQESDQAWADYGELIAARDVIYRIFAAIATGHQPTQTDLNVLKATYAKSVFAGGLVEQDGAWIWTWPPPERLGQLLYPIAEVGVLLLQSNEHDRIRQCAGSRGSPCWLLFIDTTKSGNRKWCSPKACGARVRWQRQNGKRAAKR